MNGPANRAGNIMPLEAMMETEDLATKVSRIIPRDDGSEVKIVVEEMYGAGLQPSIDVYVLRRETPDHQWDLCNDRPHPDFKSMSREDYVNFGRSEMLRTVSIAEILSLTQMIGKPISSIG